MSYETTLRRLRRDYARRLLYCRQCFSPATLVFSDHCKSALAIRAIVIHVNFEQTLEHGHVFGCAYTDANGWQPYVSGDLKRYGLIERVE